jgi:hypothetical protein
MVNPACSGMPAGWPGTELQPGTAGYRSVTRLRDDADLYKLPPDLRTVDVQLPWSTKPGATVTGLTVR